MFFKKNEKLNYKFQILELNKKLKILEKRNTYLEIENIALNKQNKRLKNELSIEKQKLFFLKKSIDNKK